MSRSTGSSWESISASSLGSVEAWLDGHEDVDEQLGPQSHLGDRVTRGLELQHPLVEPARARRTGRRRSGRRTARRPRSAPPAGRRTPSRPRGARGRRRADPARARHDRGRPGSAADASAGAGSSSARRSSWVARAMEPASRAASPSSARNAATSASPEPGELTRCSATDSARFAAEPEQPRRAGVELALHHLGQLGLHRRAQQRVQELHGVAVLQDARHLEPGGLIDRGRLVQPGQLRGQVQRAAVAQHRRGLRQQRRPRGRARPAARRRSAAGTGCPLRTKVCRLGRSRSGRAAAARGGRTRCRARPSGTRRRTRPAPGSRASPPPRRPLPRATRSPARAPRSRAALPSRPAAAGPRGSRPAGWPPASSPAAPRCRPARRAAPSATRRPPSGRRRWPGRAATARPATRQPLAPVVDAVGEVGTGREQGDREPGRPLECVDAAGLLDGRAEQPAQHFERRGRGQVAGTDDPGAGAALPAPLDGVLHQACSCRDRPDPPAAGRFRDPPRDARRLRRSPRSPRHARTAGSTSRHPLDEPAPRWWHGRRLPAPFFSQGSVPGTA